MTMRFIAATRNALTDLLVDRMDAGAAAGTVKIYTGSQPASAADAASGTLLVTITCSDPAFGNSGAVTAGTATANAIAAVNAAATGTAGWFRAADSNGLVVEDGTCTATGGGGEMELSTLSLVSGVPVDITAWDVTAPGL